MKTIANIVSSLLLVGWIISFAIFSIQNIQPVSIKFLIFNSVELPIGVLLAFSVSIGIVAGAIAPLWLPLRANARLKTSRVSREDLE